MPVPVIRSNQLNIILPTLLYRLSTNVARLPYEIFHGISG